MTFYDKFFREIYLFVDSLNSYKFTLLLLKNSLLMNLFKFR